MPRNVRLNDDRLGSGFAEQGQSFASRIFVPFVVDRHLGAVFGQHQADRSSDPAGAPRHNRRAAFENSFTHVVFRDSEYLRRFLSRLASQRTVFWSSRERSSYASPATHAPSLHRRAQIIAPKPTRTEVKGPVVPQPLRPLCYEAKPPLPEILDQHDVAFPFLHLAVQDRPAIGRNARAHLRTFDGKDPLDGALGKVKEPNRITPPLSGNFPPASDRSGTDRLACTRSTGRRGKPLGRNTLELPGGSEWIVVARPVAKSKKPN